MHLIRSVMLLVGCGSIVKAKMSSLPFPISTSPTTASNVSIASSSLATAIPAATHSDSGNLLEYPVCAQTCVNETDPLAICDLNDIDCICGPDYRALTAVFIEDNCNITDQTSVASLADDLCGPFYSATPSVGSAVSVAIASATASYVSRLGNPDALSSFPLCSQSCSNDVGPLLKSCKYSELDCLCGAEFLSVVAACQQIACNATENDLTKVLAVELCGPIYKTSPGLGASVQSAIASATIAAAAFASASPAAVAAAFKDATKIGSYPVCGQHCINDNLPASGCGSLTNRNCVCRGSFNGIVGACEEAKCDSSDQQTIIRMATELCSPLGVNLNGSNTTFTPTTSPPNPATSKFAGGVGTLSVGWGAIGVMGFGLWAVLGS